MFVTPGYCFWKRINISLLNLLISSYTNPYSTLKYRECVNWVGVE